MIIVAVLVLPVAGLLLLGMDRMEEWLAHPPDPGPRRKADGVLGRLRRRLPGRGALAAVTRADGRAVAGRR